MRGPALHECRIAFGLGLESLGSRERQVLFIALAAALVGPIAAMVVPWAAKLIVDKVIGQGQRELLFPIALVAGFGVVVQAGAAFASTQLGAVAGQRVVARLRQRVQRHTLGLPVRFFDDQQTGNLISRIISDTEQARHLVGVGALQIVSGTVSAAIAFVVLLLISWRLTLWLTVILLVMTLCLTKGTSQLHAAFQAAAEMQASLAGRMTQVLGGIRVVKTCGAERFEAHAFARDTHRILRASVHASCQLSSLIATIALATGGVSLTLLVLGGQAVADKVMTLGDLALYVVLLGVLSTPLVQAATIGGDLSRASAALARVAEVLSIPVEIAKDVRKQGAIPALTGDVVFDRVSYAYVVGQPVLSGVSFSAPAGSITAVSGPNGAGKSTLLALLMGLDKPTEGRILVDGRSLGSVPLREYRRQLGVVLQANDVFRGTLRQNICYGRPGASPDDFRRAVRLSHCDEFAEILPHGYETLVGERGVTLSGGQRQRLAIARAILADPRILLLDEATSHLDAECEHLIQEAIAALCNDRTTLVIAHRPSTMRLADQILLLRGGAIVERGTHDQLVLRGERYAQLFKAQQELLAGGSVRCSSGVHEIGPPNSLTNERALNVT